MKTPPTMENEPDIDKPIYSVTLSPNRSLSVTAMALFLAGFAALNLIAGVLFWYAGAWPVMGFMGLDVLLVWLALHWSNRQALRSENVTLTRSELQLCRFDPAGRLLEKLVFPRGFVHVDLERDEERELIGRLLLRSRGRTYELGSFLGAKERLALARALEKALATPKI
jgi:uncharacterized membrane protein